MSKKRHIVVFFLNAVMFLGSPFTASICLAVSIKVFVSIAPQKYFVHQIGKELVDVQVMVQPGASPTTYEPKPKQMADLSKTEVYFATGVPFEKAWLKKIAATNPELKVVHTDREIQKIPMAVYHRHKEGELYNKGEHPIKAGRHQKDGNKDQEDHPDHHCPTPDLLQECRAFGKRDRRPCGSCRPAGRGLVVESSRSGIQN
jgi:ABC-type Zn uptake system ZnuABC Zn-binding protein ZnuA